MFGVEIGIHYSWLIVFALVTATLALGYFRQEFPGWSSQDRWVVAAAASLLLFASVLVHELTHSLVAIHRGMPVESITLFIFGGVSNIKKEAESAFDELIVSVVGPGSSVVLGFAFYGAAIVAAGISEQLFVLLQYMAAVNILLAVFNMIPGFPLDGGRVFRAIVWYITGNMRRATKIAGTVGQGVAYLFIFGGLYMVFRGNFIGGIWIMVIGWFLSNAADMSVRQVEFQERFRGIRVGEIMNSHPTTVSPSISLRHLVEEFVLQRNLRAVPVVEGDQLVGMITLSDIRHVPQEQWDMVTVGEVMSGAGQLKTILPEDDLSKAVQALAEEDLNQLPVVRGRSLVGMLTRSNLIRFLKIREELGLRA
ncbi:MAG: site-2 protease family protein [Chloroflexi bacterium]|nr:site-2 protease family protein [Chloroflexota bacterium]